MGRLKDTYIRNGYFQAEHEEWEARKAAGEVDPAEQDDRGSPLMTMDEVEQLTRLDASTITRLVASQRFPAPVQLSERRRAWRSGDVRRWIANLRDWNSI